MRPESSALNITERIDALARALRAAGVPDEQCAGLLASAATAAMHAVVLDAVLDELQAPAHTPAATAAAAQPVRIAA
ncbi:MAG: hypothetical protein QOF43_1806 [Gaiellaceae bacterium]|jgi:non-ribosomal peptide synthetase component F|nr:hypothetical protein [Gaiellaceae bacterium]